MMQGVFITKDIQWVDADAPLDVSVSILKLIFGRVWGKKRLGDLACA